MKILLSSEKNFYKANLHCHTNCSDAKFSPAQVKEEYKSRGYSIVAYTDHDIFITHDELNDENFLALHGFEVEINENSNYPGGYDIKSCHICMIAIDPDNLTQPLWNDKYAYVGKAASYIPSIKKSDEGYERIYSCEGISEMMETYRERGFFVTYNHPTWSNERYPEYTGYRGMHAMEIMNGSSMTIFRDEYNPRVYDDLLSVGKRIYCIGADDNHNYGKRDTADWDSGLAFTMINAESLEYKTVTGALLAGDFYASEGPEIYDLTYDEGTVKIKTSPAKRIYVTSGIRRAYGKDAQIGEHLTECEFKLHDDIKWFRITVVDDRGKRAFTSAYFLDTLAD